MTDQSYLLENDEKSNSAKGKWLGRLAKLIFFVTAIFLILVTILANMGGNSESLRGQVEGFASELFYGQPAKLKTLRRLSFFPTSGIDLEGLEIYATESSLVPIFSVDKLKYFMSFWSIATQTPYFKDLNVENVKAVKGLFGPQEIIIEKIYVDHDNINNRAHLRGNGKLGIHKWAFSNELGVQPSGKTYKYRLLEKSPFTLTLADVDVKGHFENDRGAAYILKDLSITSNSGEMHGDIVLSAPSENLMSIRAALILGKQALPTQSEEAPKSVQPDLTTNITVNFANNPIKYAGSIEVASVDSDNVLGEKSPLAIVKRVRDVLGYSAFEQNGKQIGSFLGPYDMDLKIVLKDSNMLKNHPNADFAFDVVQEQKNIRIGPVSANEDNILPPILILKAENLEKRVIVIAPGTFNLAKLDEYAPVYDKETIAPMSEVRCGLGFARYEGRVMAFENLMIENENGKTFKMSDIRFENGNSLKNARLDEIGSFGFDTVDLDFQTYDFALPAMETVQGKADCFEKYFTRLDPPPPPEPENTVQEDEAGSKKIDNR